MGYVEDNKSEIIESFTQSLVDAVEGGSFGVLLSWKDEDETIKMRSCINGFTQIDFYGTLEMFKQNYFVEDLKKNQEHNFRDIEDKLNEGDNY